ncbi:MAG: hypothetical protein WA005_09040 [Candidatus Binataceae bacterium]
MTNEARLATTARAEAETSDALRLAQYSLLNEMPGLVFGLITLTYIVSALASLL